MLKYKSKFNFHNKGDSMSKEEKVIDVKPEAKEEKDTSAKKFNLVVSGNNGEEFVFSGPENADVALLENVAYTLLSRFVYHRIHEGLIKEAQEKKEAEEKAGPEKKEIKDTSVKK
jgi:hypothetical protein